MLLGHRSALAQTEQIADCVRSFKTGSVAQTRPERARSSDFNPYLAQDATVESVPEGRDRSCFIIMPISTPTDLRAIYGDLDHFRHVLEYLFVPAVKQAGFEPIPPAASGAEMIHQRILQHLDRAQLTLCDMSTLNANVFFELGIRTALNRPVCLIRDDVTAAVPFDIGVMNYHTYASALRPWSIEEEVRRLATHIQASSSPTVENNTLWEALASSIDAAPQITTTSSDGARAEGGHIRDSTVVASEIAVVLGALPEVSVSEIFPEDSLRRLRLTLTAPISEDVRRVIRQRASALGWEILIDVDRTELIEVPIDEV